MNVHNMMEDIVIKAVNNNYDQIVNGKKNWLSCDCKNCRLGTITYVLNRIPPKYVVSGRGVTHSADVFEDFQLLADIQSLCLEGMKIVNNAKRPFHSENKAKKVDSKPTPAFNFSTIIGTVLDGSTFEPVSGAKVVLKCDGENAEMFDESWSNPFTTCQSTKGTYNFWQKPITAKKEGIFKKFNMSLEVTAPGYEPVTTHFELSLTSEPFTNTEIDSTFSLKMKDIIIFKEGYEG